MKTILLTGFGPFGEVDVNPSQALIEEINRRKPWGDSVHMITEILPVVYDEVARRVRGLIQTHQPDLILSFGVAPRREKVMPERVALNLKDTQQPDNAGNTPEGELIAPEAPLAYFSNLPLLEVQNILRAAGIPTAISNHAGAYICNAVFFAAAHEISILGSEARFGFIHIPLISDQPEEKDGLTLSALVDGVTELVSWLLLQR